MPVFTIASIKGQQKSPLKCLIHVKVLKIVDMDTYVVSDATSAIVLDTSNNPKLSQTFPKSSYVKIIAPVLLNEKFVVSSCTSIMPATPIPTLEDVDLTKFTSTSKFTSVREVSQLRPPAKINMIAKFLEKSKPIQQTYSEAVYSTLIDSAGHELNLTMYKGAWDLVEVGKTYLCHNLQVDNYQIDGVHQLRTLAFSTLWKQMLIKKLPTRKT